MIFESYPLLGYNYRWLKLERVRQGFFHRYLLSQYRVILRKLAKQLEAQTRLMLGMYLEYKVTEKVAEGPLQGTA